MKTRAVGPGLSVLPVAVLALGVAAILSGCNPPAGIADSAPKALFMIVDGIPADVIEAVDTPHLDEIAAGGGYTRAYVGGTAGAESESPTVSATGYNSLLTGTWANKHQVLDNEINNPDYSYWDIFRIAKTHNLNLKTAVFSTWLDNRTRLIGDGLEAAGGSKLDYYFDGFELDTGRFPHDEESHYIREIDALVVNEAARYVGENGPDLSWIYLQFTDDVGHLYGDGPEMTAAVIQMDEWVGAVWASIKQRQAAYDEEWLLVVTTDHGRDAATGKDHGGQSERERTTWIVTNSDRLNTNFGNMPSIVDILPSLATHLELDIPEAVAQKFDGHSFID
jgi:predicted AlkP superfamily pyrophosphatase or phosphodiesterase